MRKQIYGLASLVEQEWGTDLFEELALLLDGIDIWKRFRPLSYSRVS